MSKPILGIDVSKLGLTISLLIDKNHYHTKVDNNKQGFEFLFKWLKQHKVKNPNYGLSKVARIWICR